MANKTGVSRTIPLSLVYSNPKFNGARQTLDYGDTTEVKNSMTNYGWIMNGDGTIEVTEINAKWLKIAVDDWKDQWQGLKDRVKKGDVSYVSPGASSAIRPGSKKAADSYVLKTYLEVFELIHVKDGKIIPPEFMAVSGNRRLSRVMDSNVDRYAAKTPELAEQFKDVKPKDRLITEVLAIVQHFASEKDLLIAQMRENTGKLAGFAQPTDKDKLMGAVSIMACGGSQNDIRRAFTDTTGQKLWHLVSLSNKFPELKLLDRLQADPDDPSFIRYSSIKGGELPKLTKRADPVSLAEMNEKARTAGKEMVKPLDGPVLEEILIGMSKKPDGNEPKMMKKENITNLKTNARNEVVKDIASAIVGNNEDVLRRMDVFHPAYNALKTLTEKNVGPDIQEILLALTSAQDLSVAIESVKYALKIKDKKAVPATIAEQKEDEEEEAKLAKPKIHAASAQGKKKAS